MNIYISLTTVPERLIIWDVFKRNLDSLLNQDFDKGYKVILNLPSVYKARNVPYIIPAGLTKLAADNPRLIINRIETDRGPIEKIAGALNIATDPEDIIVVVDDDQIYYNSMLSYIFSKMDKYPNSVIGFRGDGIIEKREFIQNNVKKYVMLGSHAFFPLKHDVHAVVPGHWHSVTYKRKFFTEDFFTDKYMGVAKSDDHIMSHYLWDKQINFAMLAWDNETDFVPVNYMVNGHGKPSHSFPIKEPLPYDHTTGMYVFRQETGDHIGYLREDFAKTWQFDCDHWYYEPPFTAADEKVAIPVVPPPPVPVNDSDVGPGDATPNQIDVDNFIYPSIAPIITLTTIPSRLKAEYEEGIKSCIRSLISQEYPGETGYRIHFNIPLTCKKTGEEYIIPQWLKDMTSNNPNFKIFRTDDKGPLTKILPTLDRFTDPEAIIVVCDDDLVYHPEMLKEQVINQSKYDDSVVGYDGLSMWVPLYHDVRDHYITAIRKSRKVKIIQHYKTVSYKRKFIKDDFKAFIDKYYTWDDDIAISAYLGLNNIKRVCTYSDKHTPDFKSLQEWQSANAACTFPVIRHTSHEGEEGCSLFRRDKELGFNEVLHTPDMLEKYIQ